MVYNHYNNGSRSSDAAKSFLDYFMGTISTDGYTVYRMFDGEDSKALHIALQEIVGRCLAFRQDSDGHNRSYR